MLHVETLTVGMLESNCHVCWNDETNEAVVVDPGEEGERILEFLRERDLNVVAIWLTHAHFDHVGALAEVKNATGAPVAIHQAEAKWPESQLLTGARLFGFSHPTCSVDRTWTDGSVERALDRFWKVMHTPGHSPGGCCIVCEKENLAFTGDLVFSGGIGRVDLPGGDPEAMAASLRRFVALPEHMRCHVGHGPSTLVGVEAVTNFPIKDFLEEFPERKA